MAGETLSDNPFLILLQNGPKVLRIISDAYAPTMQTYRLKRFFRFLLSAGTTEVLLFPCHTADPYKSSNCTG